MKNTSQQTYIFRMEIEKRLHVSGSITTGDLNAEVRAVFEFQAPDERERLQLLSRTWRGEEV